ncbi:SGNH/GDSL hydrolase family protein [Nocardia sp. BMG111209]|uniref:SGNH/GDSL hydrolase family protein n=1 Tax=Nocardia sp. BMG111209 TaxID=1160137 RepID=UPI0005693D4D|nr:SGNH/GDSL hydrolase family protein [Nocardia sp. BMG111209]
MLFSRFVAMGDSQTEGLWDGDDRHGLVGWADRLAYRLAEDNPEVLYANLAVRARRIAEVRDEQLDTALEMRPDLVGICVGMNDVMALTSDMDEALDEMEKMYARLAEAGATVITTTFPDVRRIIPAARFIAERVDRVNDRIRLCAERYDLRLVDLFAARSMLDPRVWATDRVHGTPLGHERFALAAAEALGLDGADHSWADPLVEPLHMSRIRATYREIAWFVAVLWPWLVRRVRGISSGDDAVAKRPVLEPVLRTAAGA